MSPRHSSLHLNKSPHNEANQVLGYLPETRDPDVGGEPTITFLTIMPLETPLGVHHPQLLVLIDYRRHVFARERFTGHNVRSSTLNHLAFEIPPETWDAHRFRLADLGLAPREVSFPDMRARALFFSDPEGNELELICSGD